MPVQAEIEDSLKPIKLWVPKDRVEPAALIQLRNTASLPFVFKHVAVMPDVHLGIGATVGSVVATQNAICPAAVGVDIGCGMMAVKTDLPLEPVMSRTSRLRSLIEASIPVGFAGNREMSKTARSWEGFRNLNRLSYVDKDLQERAKLQLGSLGGGNHFIELCLDQEAKVWVLLHSGSRNIGKTLAERHIHQAKSLLRQKMIKLPDPNLAYFEKGDEELVRYLYDVNWCQGYAFENRREMMRRILEILSLEFKEGESIRELAHINCHHNYVAEELHFGEKVFVTRKGAVRAQSGEMGIIPGSMGACSFIVRGKGAADSFHSCSHGAGRRMSRTEARKRFNVRDLARETEGIECRKDQGVIDEIPSAYKDIREVMNYQSDLVEVVAELKQIICVKG